MICQSTIRRFDQTSSTAGNWRARSSKAYWITRFSTIQPNSGSPMSALSK